MPRNARQAPVARTPGRDASRYAVCSPRRSRMRPRQCCRPSVTLSTPVTSHHHCCPFVLPEPLYKMMRSPPKAPLTPALRGIREDQWFLVHPRERNRAERGVPAHRNAENPNSPATPPIDITAFSFSIRRISPTRQRGLREHLAPSHPCIYRALWNPSEPPHWMRLAVG